MKIKQFLQTNPVAKGLILCAVFVFPLLCLIGLSLTKIELIFHNIWMAFYSCLIFCLVYRSRVGKVLVCVMNGICVAAMTFLFLMGGAEIIFGVLMNAVLPFLHNPWY